MHLYLSYAAISPYRGLMSHEPMFNLREKAPLVLFGILAAVHILRLVAPDSLLNTLLPWLFLQPLSTQGLPIVQSLSSVLGHGLLHADFMHLIMNGFMIVAFGVVTIQGVRADIRMKRHPLSPVQKFWLIFIIGVIGGGIFQWGWWSLANTVNAGAVGASGGASALFATMAYAIGGRDRMLKFGLGWLVVNIVLALIGPVLGSNIAWAAHLGGYVIGIIMARLWVRPNSTAFRLN